MKRKNYVPYLGTTIFGAIIIWFVSGSMRHEDLVSPLTIVVWWIFLVLASAVIGKSDPSNHD